MKKIVSLFGDLTPDFAHLNQQATEYAAGKGLIYEWHRMNPFSNEKALEALAGADAGIIDINPFNESIFSEMDKKTKLLVRFGVGFDQVDLPAASRHGLAIARTTGANTIGVAEMAMTLLLSTKRQLRQNQECVASGVWAKNVARELFGATVGILGFGAIGQTLAGLLSGFQCKIITYDPFPSPAALTKYGATSVSLAELFRQADAISLHLPINPETRGLIGEELLSTMKPHAVIVNTARGGLIDETALAKLLAEGRIGGAGLDVFAEEPLPLTSPLIGQSGAVLTPHVSSQTRESLWRIYAMAIDICADFFAGKDSPHILNPDYKNAL